MKQHIIEPRILKGFRDFLPDAQIIRERILSTLEKVYRRYGFVPIDTPILEYTEVLLGKGGGETDKQIYRFEDNGGRDVSMRFDLTVPFARFMAGHYNELYLPFKRYHIGKVFRGENTQRGRFREFIQCDFDIVGTDTASADFEILQVMVRSFQALDLSRVTVRCAHRGVFNRFLRNLGISDRSAEVLRTVDKRHKIGTAETRALLTEFLSDDHADQIVSYIAPEADNQATLKKITALAGGPDEDSLRLETVLDLACETGIDSSIVLDPSITRGLDYYTGIVFETFLDDLPEIGSVCSGGRYNDLASLYTRQHLPGVGSSVGLDRLVAALDELGSFSENVPSVEVLVFQIEQEHLSRYHQIAEMLRVKGFSVEVFPEAKKIQQQFSYAEKKGIPVGVICGGREIQDGVVNLKNLETRENREGVSLDQSAAVLEELLPYRQGSVT
jgi:histidyl-tRNA synthetase